ncbi:hypothetical protein [Pulveribacter sp.]|uniref:hypothetical protein n=1 Tax=Pulveribacter sp. TaxID=2678893 RepID=UPI0028AAFB45|nr:hypothetical protein [Pulveribacter sp.]
MSEQNETDAQHASAPDAAKPAFALQQPVAQWWPQVRAAFGAARTALAPRQRIYWRKSEHEVQPAVLLRFGPKRALIELREPERYVRSSWLRHERWVDPQALAPRVLPHREFGEPLELHDHGHHIAAWRHPARGHAAFPDGVWYGQIDGTVTGAPCASEQVAMHQAWTALTRGGWRTHLISQKDALQRQLASAAPGRAQELAEQLQGLCQNLAKLDTLEALQAGQPQAVEIERGNPERGPATGAGFGRRVPALLLRCEGHQVLCRLVQDDPHAVAAPSRAGQEGWWEARQIRWLAGDGQRPATAQPATAGAA